MTSARTAYERAVDPTIVMAHTDAFLAVHDSLAEPLGSAAPALRTVV